MNSIFIDADVILDLLLRREPYVSSTAALFSLIEEKKIIAFTSPVVLANIYYISARVVDRKNALDFIRKLLSLLKVTAVDEKIMLLAIDSSFKDFEDSIQYYAAKSQAVDYLLTRNKADYKVQDITVCTPDEYLSVYYQPSTN
jgi:predicted nucleic acid-binding protein